jgi:hypothetical protein
VRHAGGDEHGVAGGHRDGVEAGQQRLGPLGLDQAGQPTGVHVLAEAQMDDRVGVVAADDHPGLGLAPRAVEVTAGEVAVRVAVDRQALAGVQQLDQQRRVVAVGIGVVLSQEALGVGADRLAQRAAVLEPGQAVVGRPERGRGRADPVLGKEPAVGPGRAAAQLVDGRPAPVEAGKPVGGQRDRLHGRSFPPIR